MCLQVYLQRSELCRELFSLKVKHDKKNIDAAEFWCWRRLLRIPWTVKKTNQWIIEQINPDFSLKEQMTRLKLSYFKHIMQRLRSLEKALMLEGKRRRMMTSSKVDGLSYSHYGYTVERSEGPN